jgi:hypothetical protein
MSNNAREIVSQEWQRAVDEYELRPGSVTETVVSRIINRLDEALDRSQIYKIESDGFAGLSVAPADQGWSRAMTGRVIETTDYGSLFLHVATKEDIEYERQRVEAEYGRKVAVYRITFETRSGAKVTHVEWEFVG